MPDRAVLDLVRPARPGAGPVPGAVSPAGLVAQVAAAYPTARVLVVAARLAESRRVRGGLRPHAHRVGLFTGRDQSADAPRVTVCTYLGLAADGVAARPWDVAVYLDPADLFHTRHDVGLAGLERLPAARRPACCRPTGCARRTRPPGPPPCSGRSRCTSPSTAGSAARSTSPHPAGRRRSVQRGGDDPAGVRRATVWRHPALPNRRAARLFAALTAGRADRLAGFPGLGRVPAGPTAGRAVLLADGVEQAAELARRLTGVPVAADPDADLGGLPAGIRERFAAGVVGPAGR
ncbi:MAG: hypothetical protein U0871_09550 [Gemmataceae bacterium]